MTALLRSGSPTVDEILECLNHYRIRATYEATGTVLGCGPRNVGALLREARPLASWIVAKSGPHKGLPSDDAYHDNSLLMHPDLERNPHVIATSQELLALITAYRIRYLTQD